MASSVEFGPGIRLVAPIRSTNRSSVTQPRAATSSSRIIAVCAAGPPNATRPSRRNTGRPLAGPSEQVAIRSRQHPVSPCAWPGSARVAGSPHAWNQPHPGRGRHPRLPPGRHVVLHRPGPHDRRHPFGSTTTIEFTCPSPGARRSPTWSARRSTRSRSTASPSTLSATRTTGSRSPAWRPTTRSWSGPTAPTRARVRACTGSSTPPTTASTSTRSSRCRTPAASTPPSSSPTSRRRTRSP